MAFDVEEYRQRRQQRQQQRQAQQRRTVVKLVIAAAALILCAVIIVVVAQRSGPADPSETTQPPVSTVSPSDSTQSVTEPTEPYTVIHFAAAGDLNINETVVSSGGFDHDYSRTFLDVAHLLADADITALNFEGILCGPPYGTSTSAPQTMLQTLSAAGVDMLQLANSCTINQGMSGLAATISAVRAAGLEPLGVYETQEAFRQGKGYTIRTVQGIRIAFVAFTKGMDGLALPAGNEDCVNVLYKDYASTYQEVDTQGITEVLRAVQKEKPDLTVAMLHWGSEFNNTVSTTQEQICTLLQENGVDAIIGTHPHYVQKMVFDPDAGTFVAYSLGDFCSDAQRAGSEYSVILDMEITKDNTTGITQITDFSYTPIFSVVEKDKPLRVMRIREAMEAYEAGHIESVSPETYAAMQYALQRIEARIAGE